MQPNQTDTETVQQTEGGGTVASSDLLGGWRPIETAPKDGTVVLLWAHNLLHSGRCVAAQYIEHDIEYWHVDDGKFGPYPLRGPSPTHWMPIPNPPNARTEPPARRKEEKP